MIVDWDATRPLHSLDYHSQAGSILSVAEIKRATKEDSDQLKTIIQEVHKTKDAVTAECYNEALAIATEEGYANATSLLILAGAKNLYDCTQKAVMKQHFKVASLTLLCYGASERNIQLVEFLLSDSVVDKGTPQVIQSLQADYAKELDGKNLVDELR